VTGQLGSLLFYPKWEQFLSCLGKLDSTVRLLVSLQRDAPRHRDGHHPYLVTEFPDRRDADGTAWFGLEESKTDWSERPAREPSRTAGTTRSQQVADVRMGY
jgi:hypothetical protein